MPESKQHNYLKGAAILASSAIIAKIIGAIFKIPLYNLIGDEGTGHFQITYQIYTVLLSISTAGIPVALSRLTAAAAATGQRQLVNRYFSSALGAFAIIGAVFSALMFIFAPQLAIFMEDELAAGGIRVLAPAVFFCCIIAVYEGFWQGHGNMIPTVIKQIIEVTSKLILGLAAAWLFIRWGYNSATVSAGAIIGVVIGLAIALPVLIIYKKRKAHMLAEDYTAERQEPVGGRLNTLARILKVSIPITLGSSFISIMTLIDMKIVLLRLKTGAMLSETMAVSMLGIYGQAAAFMLLPSALIVPITVSIIPAISAALASGRHREAKGIMESSMKLVALIALPVGIGMSVLARPIFGVVYGMESVEIGARILTIFGAAAIFSCMQLTSTAILQANGFERIPMIAFLVGGLVQISVDWILVGNPAIGIVGSPVGSLSGYFTVTLINLTAILIKVKDRPNFARVFVRPLLCAAVMGVGARASHSLIERVLSPVLGGGRLASAVYLAGAVLVAVVVYFVLVIASRAITREDMRQVPKGEKLSRILHIR